MMKNLKNTLSRVALGTSMAAMTLCTGAFAADAGFGAVVNPIVDLINQLLGPLLAIVGAVGALYCVVLGVKFAKAEEPQDREKAKGALKNAIIGFVLIFVLILALNIMMPRMIKWVNGSNTSGKNGAATTIISESSINNAGGSVG